MKIRFLKQHGKYAAGEVVDLPYQQAKYLVLIKVAEEEPAEKVVKKDKPEKVQINKPPSKKRIKKPGS